MCRHHHDDEHRTPRYITVAYSFRQLSDMLRHIARNGRRTIELLENLTIGMEQLMSNQEHLDADVAALTTQFAEVQAEIEALKNQPGAEALDFTGLDAVVQSVSDAVPDAEPAPDPVDDGAADDEPAA